MKDSRSMSSNLSFILARKYPDPVTILFLGTELSEVVAAYGCKGVTISFLST